MKHRFIASIIFVLIAFIFLEDGVNAQSAEIITTDKDICEFESIEIEIKFIGTPPFNAYIKIYNNENNVWLGSYPSFISNCTPAADGICKASFPYPSLVESSNPDFSQIRVEITEFMDNSGIPSTNVTGQTIITSYTKPTPNPIVDANNCGLSIPLTAIPGPYGDIYEWTSTGPSLGYFLPGNNPSTVFSATTAGIYDVNFKVKNGVCEASAPFKVELKGSPTGEISTTSKVCETGTAKLNLDLTGTGPWDVRYNNGVSNLDENGILGNNHSWDLSVTGETTFKLVRIEDTSTGCTSASTQMTGEATVLDLKQTVNAGPDEVACGNSYTMQAIAGAGTGTWSGPTGSTFSSVSSPTSEVTIAGFGLQTFTWTLDNEGCLSANDVTIRFVELPTVSIIDATPAVCEGSTGQANLNLTGSSPWNLSYLSGTTLESASLTASPAIISLSPTETTTYHLSKITDYYGCSSNYSTLNFTIMVDEMPTPNAGDNIEVCGLEPVELTATASIGTGQWTGPGTFGNSASPGSSYENNFGTYTLRWTEINGVCEAWDETVVTFWEAPQTTNAGEDQTLYLKFETQMQAETPIVGLGTWSLINGYGNIVSANNPTSDITGLNFGSATFRWTVSNGNCPTFEDDLTIEVEGLKHPTGFSPDGNDINDKFIITGATYIENNELIVFNQAGKVVYKTKDYQNDWYGIGLDGDKVPDGYYYYIFTGKGIKPIKDFLVIKRQTR